MDIETLMPYEPYGNSKAHELWETSLFTSEGGSKPKSLQCEKVHSLRSQLILSRYDWYSCTKKTTHYWKGEIRKLQSRKKILEERVDKATDRGDKIQCTLLPPEPPYPTASPLLTQHCSQSGQRRRVQRSAAILCFIVTKHFWQQPNPAYD